MDTIWPIDKKVTKKTKSTPFLPDEIIINILTWLPAKSVMRCRVVCKRWRDLTVTRDFVDSHLRSSIPSILVSTFKCDSRLDFFALDELRELAGSSQTLIHGFPTPFNSRNFLSSCCALFSHDGLVVLEENFSVEAKFIILNPARPDHEHVRITLPKELRTSKIFGVYFHPTRKQYCSLWKIEESLGPFQNQIQYNVLSLGSDLSLKTISNPFRNRIEKNHAKPLFMNNYLYWLLESAHDQHIYRERNDIMEFDVIMEEFMIIPCPVPLNTNCIDCRISLLNIDGVLSFLLIIPSKISIWRLEDHAQLLWTATEYTFRANIYCDDCRWYKVVGGIAFVDGKLVVSWKRRLFVYNLMEGTVSKLPEKNMYCTDLLFLSHHISLDSLSNRETAISISFLQDDKIKGGGQDRR